MRADSPEQRLQAWRQDLFGGSDRQKFYTALVAVSRPRDAPRRGGGPMSEQSTALLEALRTELEATLGGERPDLLVDLKGVPKELLVDLRDQLFQNSWQHVRDTVPRMTRHVVRCVASPAAAHHAWLGCAATDALFVHY
jgi:hypothetical protein